MAKLEEAKVILAALGLPPQQQSTIAGYTLLALTKLGQKDPWSRATRHSIKIHDMMRWIASEYRKDYAENTRETVRRQVLHQLEAARVVDRNPDDPALPTNSPRTHYALSQAALRVVRAFSTGAFEQRASDFQKRHGTLLEVYRAERRKALIPVRLPESVTIALSPGKHNELQASVIAQFAPRFVPRARVAYIGDAANKSLHMDAALLRRLKIPVTRHGKLPDIVLFSVSKGWVFLVEAVTSHGPISPKRVQELDKLLEVTPHRRVYVTAFPDFSMFRKHISAVAWETEVWIADVPDHLIHYNGDHFLR